MRDPVVGGQCLHALLHEGDSLEAKAGAVWLAVCLKYWMKQNGLAV